MWSMVTWLQDNFSFKKIEEIIHIYKEIMKEAYKLFQSVYKVASSANEFGREEK